MPKTFMVFVNEDEEKVYAVDVYEALRDMGIQVTKVSPITDEDGE